MNIYQSSDSIPEKRYAVAVGMFDGIHLGHRAILQKLVEEAKRTKSESLVFTFDVHPKKLLHDVPFKPITTKLDKVECLQEFGIKNVVFYPFDYEIAEMSAEDFIEKILVGRFHASSIIIGDNHRFGNKQMGDYHMLQLCAEKYGFAVHAVPPVYYEEKMVSSTWVRQSIVEGKLRLTRELLNRFYSIRGTVVTGEGRGQKIGFPTANIEDVETKMPVDGIYSTFVEYGGKRYGAMTYIGFSPTFEGEKKKIETHIFNFNKKIYGEELKVSFVARIRDEDRFENQSELKRKLLIDKNITLNILADEGIDI